MTCREVERYWEHWLEGTAPLKFHQHLNACPRCRQQAAGLRRTSSWMALLRRPGPEPGPAFWGRLRGRLGQEQVATDFWGTLSWAAARTVLALGVIVLLLGLGIWLQPGSSAPPEPVVAEFDAPHAYADEGSALAIASQDINRDQVVVTLVAYTEPQQ